MPSSKKIKPAKNLKQIFNAALFEVKLSEKAKP